MAVTQVGTLNKGGTSAATGASVPVSRDSGTQVGDLIVVVIGTKVTWNATQSTDVCAPPDGTWTLIDYGAYGTTAANGHWEAWAKTATTSGAQSYTFTMISSNAFVWFCQVLRGASGVTTVLGKTSQQAPGTSVATASITPTEDAEYILRFLGGTVSSGATPMTGSSLAWPSPVSKLGDQQGSSGTGIAWASLATETGPTPAAALGARTITLPNSPNGVGTFALGVAAAAVIAPSNTAIPVITTDGSPETGETVTASTGGWSNSPTSYAYQWKRNGTNISSAISSSYVLVVADEGQVLTVTVTATNGAGSASATSDPIAPAAPTPVSPPVNTLAPAISGTLAAGTVATCSTGTWTNSPTSYTYQWLRNGVAISGATSSTYTLTALDVGSAKVSCSVTAINSGAPSGVTANAPSVSVTQAVGDFTVIRYRVT